jgi:hypothetical protein
MNELYFYFTPKRVSSADLRLDNGETIMGYGPVGAHGRDNAYHFQIPSGTGRQGAMLTVTAEGYQPVKQRGLVIPNENGEGLFAADEYTLVAEGTSTTTPPKGELDEGKQDPIKPPVG